MTASSGLPSHGQVDTRRAGNTVNDALTPKRRLLITENSEYAAFARRILRAYSRRIATGDVESLAQLVSLSTHIDDAIQQAVNGLRTVGYSWAEISKRLGTTRQAAQQRWGRRPDASPLNQELRFFGLPVMRSKVTFTATISL